MYFRREMGGRGEKPEDTNDQSCGAAPCRRDTEAPLLEKDLLSPHLWQIRVSAVGTDPWQTLLGAAPFGVISSPLDSRLSGCGVYRNYLGSWVNLERASSVCSSVSHTEVVNLLPGVPDDTHQSLRTTILACLVFLHPITYWFPVFL